MWSWWRDSKDGVCGKIFKTYLVGFSIFNLFVAAVYVVHRPMVGLKSNVLMLWFFVLVGLVYRSIFKTYLQRKWMGKKNSTPITEMRWAYFDKYHTFVAFCAEIFSLWVSTVKLWLSLIPWTIILLSSPNKNDCALHLKGSGWIFPYAFNFSFFKKTWVLS